MARGQQPTDRLQVVLALKTLAFLDLLAAKGIYGTSTSDVARGFIEKGIRDAIKEKTLSEEEVKVVQQT